MTKRIIAAIAAVIIVIPLASCRSNTKTRYEAEFLTLFDTVTQLIAYTDSKETFTQQSQFIYDQLKEYHELYDIYNNYDGINNIKTINDQAGKAPVKVDQKIIDLLLLAKEMYQKSNGKINVAFGSVLSIWHDYRTRGIDDFEHAELPPMDKLIAASAHTDINQVVIDQVALTVFLKDPDMRLDVGSIGKGYATEQVCRSAADAGFSSILVSVGGNVRAIGSKDGSKTPWNVGIQNPNSSSDKKSLCTVNLNDQSLVTSGAYQRYYTVNGKSYHHIIDPKTLMPSAYFTAVTVVCKDSGMADALTTILFNMPLEQGKAYVENLSDTEALWVLLDGSLQYSTGFEAHMKDPFGKN